MVSITGNLTDQIHYSLTYTSDSLDPVTARLTLTSHSDTEHTVRLHTHPFLTLNDTVTRHLTPDSNTTTFTIYPDRISTLDLDTATIELDETPHEIPIAPAGFFICTATLDSDASADTVLETIEDYYTQFTGDPYQQFVRETAHVLPSRLYTELLGQLNAVSSHLDHYLYRYRYQPFYSLLEGTHPYAASNLTEIQTLLVKTRDCLDNPPSLIRLCGRYLRRTSDVDTALSRLQSLGIDPTADPYAQSTEFVACWCAALIVSSGYDDAVNYLRTFDPSSEQYLALKQTAESASHPDRPDAWKDATIGAVHHYEHDIKYTLTNFLYWSTEADAVDGYTTPLVSDATKRVAPPGLDKVAQKAEFQKRFSKAHTARRRRRFEHAADMFSRSLEVARGDTLYGDEMIPRCAYLATGGLASTRANHYLRHRNYEEAVNALKVALSVMDRLESEHGVELVNFRTRIEGKLHEAEYEQMSKDGEIEDAVNKLETAAERYMAAGKSQSLTRVQSELEELSV